MVSKFYNKIHDPKGQENKIDTIVKDRETYYGCHTVQNHQFVAKTNVFLKKVFLLEDINSF